LRVGYLHGSRAFEPLRGEHGERRGAQRGCQRAEAWALCRALFGRLDGLLGRLDGLLGRLDGLLGRLRGFLRLVLHRKLPGQLGCG
jgi:hypothetical protein